MTSNLLLLPYKRYSAGAKLLKETLKAKWARKQTLRRFPNKNIINWGCSNKTFPYQRWSLGYKKKVLNHPIPISIASNKLSTLFYLQGSVNIPEWTENRSEAVLWLSRGVPVVCRTLLSSHSGKGIVIANNEEELVDAPLYTQYIKKTRECRIHVFNGTIIHVQEKKRDKSIPDEEVNWKVRNKQNGFAYTFKSLKPISPEGLRQGLLAIKTLGLDFGAVDIIYNKQEDKWYVLEVNTAPGLYGTTLDKYVNAIMRAF